MREPKVAGRFYPSNKNRLKEEIGKYLEEEKDKNKNIKAAIVPHAGYQFSGRLAGKTLSRFPSSKNFIILGVNHSGLGNKISISKEDFSTPLGKIKNNLEKGKKIKELLKNGGLEVDFDELPHEREHSIEVELPFLQESQKNFSIIPILLRDLNYEECMGIARILSEFIDRETRVIVSSDFTHYGKRFNYEPFKDNIKDNMYELDKGIIKSIIDKNSKEVFEEGNKTTICGLYGITILTEIASINQWKGEAIDYYTSGDITGQWKSVVGYSGIVFSDN